MAYSTPVDVNLLLCQHVPESVPAIASLVPSDQSSLSAAACQHPNEQFDQHSGGETSNKQGDKDKVVIAVAVVLGDVEENTVAE